MPGRADVVTGARYTPVCRIGRRIGGGAYEAMG